MSQFFNDHEIQNPGSSLIICGPEKNLKEKNCGFLRKCFFREKDSLNADKRQQIAKTIISICFHCSKSRAFTSP